MVVTPCTIMMMTSHDGESSLIIVQSSLPIPPLSGPAVLENGGKGSHNRFYEEKTYSGLVNQWLSAVLRGYCWGVTEGVLLGRCGQRRGSIGR